MARRFDFADVLSYETTSTNPAENPHAQVLTRITQPARTRWPWLLTAWLLCLYAAHASLVINEILFNPPGSDVPNEYVELRGKANLPLGQGTYLLSVDGDANGNPGTIQNVFDLSRQRFGGNGLLVVLQNSNSFNPNPNAMMLVNTNGSGFGSGSSSTVNHRGRSGQTDLENPSVTYLLVRSTNAPVAGTDLDLNDDGVFDNSVATNWVVLDAVAVLDNDGAGDFGYGLINFRRDTVPGNGAIAVSGTVVTVDFTAGYVGRTGNNFDWSSNSWVAAVVAGSAPSFSLSAGDTTPAMFGGLPLNHLGSPNFGAPALPGLVVRESGGSTDLNEGTGYDTFTIALNTVPTSPVTVMVSGGTFLRVSTNGVDWDISQNITLNNTNAVTLFVTAPDNHWVGAWVPPPLVVFQLDSLDPAYPIGVQPVFVPVRVAENDYALFNELKVNPPGTNDAPCEFIELLTLPARQFTNVHLLVLDGNADGNPGEVKFSIDLTALYVPQNVIVFAAPDHPYSRTSGLPILTLSQLDQPGGALGNGAVTFLLVGSPVAIPEGTDLDAGDNGVLEGLPEGVVVFDSVGWGGGDEDDHVYSPAKLSQSMGRPDAASRWPGNLNGSSAAAWFNGNLRDDGCGTLVYESEGGSFGFPYGSSLTIGALNKVAPLITPLPPVSGVVGDPTTPPIMFQISDAGSPPEAIAVSVNSDNPSVVPNANLFLSGAGATRSLMIQPTNVGYARITITAAGNTLTGSMTFRYAASIDPRGGGRFHTGASDASSAMAIDASYMLVADDENQILRLFSRSNSGPAIVEYNMTPFLDLNDRYEDGRPREVDLEGSTRVGNRIYWLGSHSHSRDFEVVTNRARIFATDVVFNATNTTVNYVGQYNFLKLDLMLWDATNGHGKGAHYYGLTASGAPGVDPKSLDGSGFNFEGITMAPGSTNVAYLAMRAPLVPPTNRVKALVIPVTNFAALAVCNSTNPGVARFGMPIELNLGGRGVRSIEGDSNGYVIVAGPPGLANGQAPRDFRLFTWNGLPSSAPQERGANLDYMLPEGIVAPPPHPWTASSQVQLISDNGITIYYNDGQEAKFLGTPQFKKARTDWVTLGPIVTPAPVFQSIARAGSDIRLNWYAVAGKTYRVQWKASLEAPLWNDVSGDVVATEAWAGKTVSSATITQGFFRVIIP